MCIKPLQLRPTERRAWTLVEMMVAMAIFSLAAVALSSLFMFSIKSMAAMTNYAMLDKENREAMDVISRELRQAKVVKSFGSNELGSSLTIVNGAGDNITYAFSSANRHLTRNMNSVSEVLLTNCSLLHFSLFQRCPSNGNYGVFPIASDNWTQTVKVVQLTWRSSRQVPSGPINSENVQTARIVIRKQQD